MALKNTSGNRNRNTRNTRPPARRHELPGPSNKSVLEQSHGCAEVPRFPLPPWPASCPRLAARPAAVHRPDLGRDPPAPPRHRRRLLPRQAGARAEGAGRRGRLILARPAASGGARSRFAASPAQVPACCSSGTRRQGPREGSTEMSEQASNQRIYSRIAGTGSYLPEKVLTNDDLAKIVDTSDEWITPRTGLRQRNDAAEGETTGDLAYHAAVRAMEAGGVEASATDMNEIGRAEGRERGGQDVEMVEVAGHLQ